MPYEIESYKFADYPNLKSEIIEQINEMDELLVVINREKDDVVYISGKVDRDMYQAEAIAKAFNELEK